jgi:3-mercaptopyruvate sulfurtransferase SseA
MEKGFKRVRPLAGGLDAWLEAGYDVEGAPEASEHTATLPTVNAV